MTPDFNTVHAHERDARLHFDADTHTYTADGIEGRLRSVTELVEDCFEKFDAEYWSERKAPSLGITPEKLRRQWQENGEQAAALGTELHARIEQYYLGCDCNADDPAYRLFKMFASAVPLTPYRTEWRIYDDEYCVAGTLDFLAQDQTDGSFEILDWKRSDKLIDRGRAITENRYGKRGLHPVSHLTDCTYWHYALQVSIYRYILETRYDIYVRRGRLGIFHPSYTRPYIVDVPYLRHEAAAVLLHCKTTI